LEDEFPTFEEFGVVFMLFKDVSDFDFIEISGFVLSVSGDERDGGPFFAEFDGIDNGVRF
jgi:hypothetical protein